MLNADQIKDRDEQDAVAAEHVAVLHALDAGIRSLSRHPEATDVLLSWLCEEYGELELLSKLKLPTNNAVDKPAE